MSLLICQIIIKQWDKGQLTPSHVAARAALPDRYAIVAKPVYCGSDRVCIIDQHGDDLPTSEFKDGRVKHVTLAEDQIRFDRFQISSTEAKNVLTYLVGNNPPVLLGNINQDWLQCRYNWRYGVEESHEFYWMYEEVTLNAVCIDEFNANYFLESQPGIVLNTL